MGVLAIWRYPVGRPALARDPLAALGVDHDPRLRACRAGVTPDGDLRITLPGGEDADGERDAAAALSELLGRHVRLERGLHRDFAPVHLVTTSTLAHLGADARRFRPNLVLDDGGAAGPYAEDSLLGRALAGPGGLALQVDLPTPRCVVPTRPAEELPAAPALLKRIAREHRFALGPVGHAACAGAYATVAGAGRVAVGDLLAVGGPTAPTPQAAAGAALHRLGLTP